MSSTNNNNINSKTNTPLTHPAKSTLSSTTKANEKALPNTIKDIVIVGGGTAGWMAAAMLSRLLGKQLNISVIESEKIGTVGVGEATIPPLQIFNSVLGISEQEFINATQGTYKLGIQFENWNKLGDSYMHAFGPIGKSLGMTEFHHYWLRQNTDTSSASFWDYSLNFQAAKNNKFQHLNTIEGSSLAGITHAYHFDASLYANYLSQYCQQRGVKRLEGIINHTQVCPQKGHIQALTLTSGDVETVIEGDFFIDCSGFKGLLIEEALQTGYENWQHWLPCDSALAVPCERTEPLTPYTRSIAHDAGWQWRIPLQSRTGNGLVYCSQYLNHNDAEKLLLANLDGKALNKPKKIQFTTGRRKQQWNKNCLSLGLASGFLEPLESTSLHMVQSGITRFIKLFPSLIDDNIKRDEFNRQSKQEFEQIRDFIILHYRLNTKADSDFWKYCSKMEIPASLQAKIDLFKSSGLVFRHQDELFTEAAWIQVMLGQGILPDSYHMQANMPKEADLKQYLSDIKTIMNRTVAHMPSHEQVLG